MDEQVKGLTMLLRWLPSPHWCSVTWVLTTAQAVLYCVLAVLAGDTAPSTCELHRFRGVFASDIALRFQLDRLFLPILLHSGFVSLVLVSLMQLRIGPELEAYYGRIRFSALYCLSGTLGCAAAAIYDKYSVLGGVSSALFGLLGSQGAILVLSQTRDPCRLERSLFYLTSVFILFCLTSLWPHSTISGHLAGLVAGFLLGILLHKQLERPWLVVCLHKVIAGLGLSLLVWFLYFEMWTVIDFLDCAFVPYEDYSGEVHYSGLNCEALCQEY